MGQAGSNWNWIILSDSLERKSGNFALPTRDFCYISSEAWAHILSFHQKRKLAICLWVRFKQMELRFCVLTCLLQLKNREGHGDRLYDFFILVRADDQEKAHYTFLDDVHYLVEENGQMIVEVYDNDLEWG
jgi:hypothetical protein